jgi:hypothetical protein
MTCQVFQVRMISYNLWRRYGRATFLQPCENAFIVKEDTIFRKTSLDETPGSSIEDKLFLEHMNTKVALDSDGLRSKYSTRLTACDLLLGNTCLFSRKGSGAFQ